MTELYTINQFCEVTNLGRTRVYQLLKQGAVKAIKIGRRTLIKKVDAQIWLDGLEAYPANTGAGEDGVNVQ